jgi:transposase
MTRSIHLEPHLRTDELATRYRSAKDPVERSHWHFLWLLARGFTAKAIASLTGYSAYWIGQIVRRYHALGPEGVKDQRRLARPPRQLLTVAHHEELRATLNEPAPQRDRWNGRTVFHLATSVSVPLFEVELAAFAQAVGASPSRQSILVLDRAGWHSTQRLRVPDHLHLLFLPPYSPELQPAEHLWPLSTTVLVHRRFAPIEALEDVQAARCLALQAQRDLVRSTTLFHWWPLRLHKRHVPKPKEYHLLRRRPPDVLPHSCAALYQV